MSDTTPPNAEKPADTELDKILNNVFTNLDIDDAGLLFDEEQHKSALKAALELWKQRWAAEARLDEVKEAKFYHTNAKSKEWFAQRIPQLEAEIAALDGVIGEPLDGLEMPSEPAK